jgi:hypothetical protein
MHQITNVPHHPCNPKMHQRSMLRFLGQAAEYAQRVRACASLGHADRAALIEIGRADAMALACESAEEAALLTGLQFSLLPGTTPRFKRNDPFNERMA